MDNRKGKSVFLFVSLLPNKDIHILDPVSHLVIYSITIAVFQHYACGYLFTMTLKASSVNVFLNKNAHPAGLAWIFLQHGLVFYYFLNYLILPVIQNAVYSCVVLIIIY